MNRQDRKREQRRIPPLDLLAEVQYELLFKVKKIESKVLVNEHPR